MRTDPDIILCCPHGGVRVPPRLRPLFRNSRDVLATHRGSDLGALPLARALAARLNTPLIATRVSRLVVDCNRHPRHPDLFSEFTRDLPAAEKQHILDAYYTPYRRAVEQAAARAAAAGRPAVHLTIHSFTPVFNGRARNVDIGLLYDPRRAAEKDFCARLQCALRRAAPLRVRRNNPYRGDFVSHPAQLRRLYPETLYLGVEIETGNSLLQGRGAVRIHTLLGDVLSEMLSQ